MGRQRMVDVFAGNRLSAGRAMSNAAPQYLLLSETQTDRYQHAGRWRFVLEQMDGSGRIEAADEEPDVRGERLQLLAVVRGLEALEQPSSVTLITPSRYVGRGFRNGLSLWRENNWQWERFGEMTTIKNFDLWQRIDRAMQFHAIDCRVWNFRRILNEQAAREMLVSRSRNRVTNRVADWSVEMPSWSKIAAAIANRINPSRLNQLYGCAGAV